MIRITQWRNKCIGCNICVEVAFYRWRISTKDGRCTLVEGVESKGLYTAIVGDDEYEINRTAAKHCPVKIIRVEKMKN